MPRCRRVFCRNRLYRGFRISATEDGDRAAAAAAGDLRPINALRRPSLARQLHQRIRPVGSQAAGRIAGMALVHQFAQLRGIRQNITFEQIGKGAHAEMFIDWVRRGLENGISAIGIDCGHFVGGAAILGQELRSGHLYGQLGRKLLLKLGRGQVGQVPMPIGAGHFL